MSTDCLSIDQFEFDDDYFIVTQPREDAETNDLLPDLAPDENTAALNFRREAIPVGHKPLIFKNSAKAFRDRRGMTNMKTPPDVLFDGDNPLVRSHIREKLLALNIPNLVLQPSIFVDDWGKWHEDYWYLTFLEPFHCWDRSKSDVGERIKVVDEYIYTIYQVSLDEEIMKATPLQQRLLFQLDTLPGLVLAHRSVAGFFRAGGQSGALVVSLEDYPNRP
jgi:hypothetical protein